MKKLTIALCVFTLLLGILPTGRIAALASPTVSPADEFRAVWVTTVINLDFPSRTGLSVNELKREIDSIVNTTRDLGLNAIILQVRPEGDAIYNSSIFPWSRYLSGTQGVAPAGGFDPLEYWVEQAHRAGLELHAWINPYRVTHTTTRITDVNLLHATNPARLNPSRAIAYQGALFLDPGLPENRQLVIDGIIEIIENYNVDGIHLDDYFYPGINFPDNATFARFGGGRSREDWRRDNVNELVKGIQRAIRETRPEVRFGISPFAIWQNASSDPRGSNTRGNESYRTMFADTRRWVKEGWVDYIAPQIYWYQGFEIADYRVLISWWADVARGTDVDLYIGLAAYREDFGRDNWEGEIIRQLTLNSTTYADVVRGNIFFRYSNLLGSVGNQIRAFYRNIPSTPPPPSVTLPVAPVMRNLTVAQPSSDVTVAERGFNFFGTSNPDIPLLMNGNPVTNRTPEGFFSIFANLSDGVNTFTFTQEGQTSVTRRVTSRAATPAAIPTMPEVSITNVFPTAAEYVSAGDTITLRATAPVSASISVRINGTTIELNDDNAARNANLGTGSIYQTTFSATYQVPAATSTRPIIDLGNPTYTMTFGGGTYIAHGAPVKLINSNAPFYATVTSDFAWVFPGPTTTGGTSWHLLEGQIDAVTAISRNGEWARLSTGMWIETENIETELKNERIENMFSGGLYVPGEHTDSIKWLTSEYLAVNVTFDGSEFKIYFPLHTNAPSIGGLTDENISEKTIFSAMRTGRANGVPYYSLTLQDGMRISGYYVSFEDGEFAINIRRPRQLSPGREPLTGFTFVIDAGHGGNDTGAVGMMGGAFAEKHINLINSIKLGDRLEQLGATVIQTRTTDEFLTLFERTEISREFKPDMFISMHANSLAATTNATTVRGITFWYRNPTSRPIANHLINELFDVNPLTTRLRSPNHANFYVTRPAWSTSVLFEVSFMNNIEDFAWMINPRYQNELADRAAQAIVNYFR
ncbi:MAG: family 10 glycosylhydrolase [Defluviitaleaceae bacterium]|nr:family 10 glycosylhydrolase [Defluviitaleaceae bacterium]